MADDWLKNLLDENHRSLVEKWLDEVRSLAAEGLNADDIAERTGSDPSHVKRMAKKHGISLTPKARHRWTAYAPFGDDLRSGRYLRCARCQLVKYQGFGDPFSSYEVHRVVKSGKNKGAIRTIHLPGWRAPACKETS